MSFLPFLFRITLTFIGAGLFGLERQRSHKPVGFGTFIFVALGSCSLAYAALVLQPDNPLGLLSAIVTGIGFLGAGAMIKTTDKIFGVTTAASIWLFAIFGLLIGVGEFVIALILYSLVWVVILVDHHYLHKFGIGSYQRKVIITTNDLLPEKHVRKCLYKGTRSFKLLEVTVDKTNKKMVLTYIVEGDKETINRLPQDLLEQHWFSSCLVQ